MPEPGRKVVKLVNRGPAGLREAVDIPEGVALPEYGPQPAGRKNHVTAGLRALVVDAHLLKFDPHNCRTHPERNVEAIKASLCLYGQTKPLVVRKQDMTVAAGNGTLTAALALGWTRIAANVIPMTEVEFIGYALADNRTAELAGWDHEALKRSQQILEAARVRPPGWTDAEILTMQGRLLVEAPDQSDAVPEAWRVLVTCNDEADQLAFLDEMLTRGKACQALTF